MADISGILKSGGIDLERTATQVFGNVVGDFSKGNLEPGLRSVFGQPENPMPDRNDGSWSATSYAHSIANTNTRPKLKFLFRVEFLFRPEIIAQYDALKNNEFVFSIKAVDRPKVDFQYEEVNKYNFRTKVLKQIQHRELTMSFHDDTGNHVYDFFRIMMMIHSPITRRSNGASHDIAAQVASYNTGHGMLFTEGLASNDFAHRGAIDTELGNAIQAIKITQMFLQPSAVDLSQAAKEVAFFFMNPRIVSFDLDDVSHEVSDPNIFTMQFDYDFMVMADIQELKKIDDSKSHPSLPGAPGEPSPAAGGGTSTPAGGGGDPLTRILAGVGGRAAQKIASETIGQSLRKVPGLDGLSTTLGGLVNSTTASAIGNISRSISASASSLMTSQNLITSVPAPLLLDTSAFGLNQIGFNSSNGSYPTAPQFFDSSIIG